MVNPPETMETLPTPALVIDDAVVERNLDRMAEYGRAHALKLRPHTKTHKSRALARRQIAAGAVGLTTAKAGEAEVMALESEDITIAYPAIDPARAEAMAGLASRGTTIRAALDADEGLETLDAAARGAVAEIGILVDLDVGFHRTGLQSPSDAARLARRTAQRRHLRLDGLFIYPGHIWAPADEQIDELRRIDALVRETIDLWERDGLAAPIVSGGSTPSAFQSHHITALTEIRPGTYIYNDMNTVYAGFCDLEQCAGRILATVVSNAVPGKAVIDAGTKTLTGDKNVTRPDAGHGFIPSLPEAKIVRLSEEHGELDVSNCSRVPRVGERLQVIPNHICPCVNLQDRLWLRTEDDRLTPLPIDARGRLS